MSRIKEAARWDAEERRWTLAVLSGEVAHELAGPANFFDQLLQQLRRREPIDPQDLDIGEEEVARLRRLIARMRTVRPREPSLRHVELAEVTARALERLSPRQCDAERLVLAIPSSLVVMADPLGLELLLTELLHHGATAASDGALWGVRAERLAEGIRIEVWDSGATMSPKRERELFAPWSLLASDGSGLSLAIALRLVRSFGWELTVERVAERNVFAVLAAHVV
jgi:signal transduction histidine kinase